jgi:hypothetical protein
MKIVTEKQELKGTKLIVPIDGTINIDSNGIAEVSPKAAALLVKSISYWAFFKEDNLRKKVEEDPDDKEPSEDDDNSEKKVEEDPDDESKKIKENLESKTLKELLTLVGELNIPEQEYKNIKNSKKLMVAFLLKKI